MLRCLVWRRWTRRQRAAIVPWLLNDTLIVYTWLSLPLFTHLRSPLFVFLFASILLLFTLVCLFICLFTSLLFTLTWVNFIILFVNGFLLFTCLLILFTTVCIQSQPCLLTNVCLHLLGYQLYHLVCLLSVVVAYLFTSHTALVFTCLHPLSFLFIPSHCLHESCFCLLFNCLPFFLALPSSFHCLLFVPKSLFAV